MALLTTVDISRSGITMESRTIHVKPGLTFGVGHPEVAVMTDRRAIIVKTTGRMTPGTDRRGIREIRRAVWNCTVRPGSFGRWVLAPSRTEVTLGATDAGTATQKIGAMTYRAAVDIGQSSRTMKGRTIGIQPVLTKRMCCTGMAIMAGRRPIIIKPAGCVALVTNA